MTNRTIELPPNMPAPMRRLPTDEVGRPIPFFAAEIDGRHDFRVMDARKLVTAILEQLCWTCGQRLRRAHGSTNPKGTFVAGPMCLVNRTSAEPPSHADCAEWAAKACPFLVKPEKERRDAHLPDHVGAAGIMIRRNPGVTGLFESERWNFYKVQANAEVGAQDGVLCDFSRITNVHWMREGRTAHPEEIREAIDTGLPQLMAIAELDDGGMRALALRTREAMRWVPAAPTEYPNIAKVLANLP